MSDEETEQPQRRRSARIIALEERKEREKKALAASRKNNPQNSNNNGSTSALSKGKGKAIVVEQDYDFIDDNSNYEDDEDDDNNDDDDEQYAPNKKRGRKSKPLHQLISSTQPMQRGQNTENRSGTSRRNGSPKIPDKHVLEFVLDLLQRKDPEELFAEPFNPDEGYYRIVKQPMDFATMRAKLHENMYTDMEQFKRDVYLICSNAMNVNPATTIYHQVAEAINEHATKVFHGLSVDPENFDLEFNLNKKQLRGRKPGRPRSSGRPRQLPPRYGERSCGADPMEPELERRHTYWPPSANSLLSEVMNAPKQNLQFTRPASNYQDSLVRFVQDMGPAAQASAARKLETLRFNQILCGETSRPNPLATFLDADANTTPTTTTTLEPTSQEQPQPSPPPTQPYHDAPSNTRPYPLCNRPLTIPGLAPQETRNVTNYNFDGSYKGKRACVDDRWDACAAALLGDIFINYDKGAGGGSYGGLNLKGEGESSIYKMPSTPFDDKMSSLLIGSSNHQNQVMQLGGASNSHHQWSNTNTPAGTSNLIDNFVSATGASGDVRPRDGSSRVRSQVWPTRVISGPQPKPMGTFEKQLSELSLLGQPKTETEYSLPGYNLSGQSSHQLRDDEEPMTSYNLSGQSLNLLSRIKPADQPMTGYNLYGQSLLSQQKPAEAMNGNSLSWQSFMSQLKPEEALSDFNFSGQSFLPQQKPTEPMTGCNFSWQSFMPQLKPEEHMTGTNLSGQCFLSQKKLTDPVTECNLSWQTFKSQPKPAEAEPMTGYHLPGQSFVSQQKPLEPMTDYNLSDQSFLRPSEPMTGNHFSDDFQAISGSPNLNNIISFPENASLYTPPPPPPMCGFSHDLPMQAEPEPEPEPSLLNPLGLFPQQEPKLSSPLSAALEMPVDLDAYYGGTAMEGQPAAAGEAATPTAQLLWNDDHHPNLALQL